MKRFVILFSLLLILFISGCALFYEEAYEEAIVLSKEFSINNITCELILAPRLGSTSKLRSQTMNMKECSLFTEGDIVWIDKIYNNLDYVEVKGIKK